MRTTVALVDDHQLFCEGFSSLLETCPDLQLVAQANDATAALATIASARPDVVIVDLALPGISGIGLARELLRQDPNWRIMALTMFRDQQRVAQALAAGLLGYATKDQTAAEVIGAIRAVARREHYLAPGLSRPRSNGPDGHELGLESLTPREREVFDLTVAGHSSAAVASQLVISKRTVETHRARILRKLGAHSATDLVRLAARLGLLPADGDVWPERRHR
jgi:DNA-binding NarL/FixJ family response regulator